MPLKAVFFDLDGTLLDTATDLGNALNALRRDCDLAALPQSLIRNHVSNGARALIKLGFPETREDSPAFEALREQLLKHYLENIAAHTTAFAGIDQLIRQIEDHGLAWGVVTNKPWTYTEPLMARFDFASKPVVMLCPDHVTERKPHPEALLTACDQIGCEPHEAIYIGDHQRDIECGLRAGMPTVAVGYGYIEVPGSHHNWNATHVVEHGEELWPILLGYLSSKNPR